MAAMDVQAEPRIRLPLALPVAPNLERKAADQDVKDWQAAFTLWLEGGWRSHGQAVSAHTRRAYHRAVDEFRAFVGEQYPMWRVQASQVRGWQNAMRSRGLSAATINLRLAGLSSLFDFLVHQFPLLMNHNPAADVVRAPVQPQRSRGLAPDEAQAILRHIHRTTAAGMQDYALVITILNTGWSSGQVTQLRWRDLDARRDALTEPAVAAIRAYLRAAGRTMSDEDYVFTALSDVAVRLPNVKSVDRGQPLSGSMVNRIVKKCARRAGLDESRIRVRTLRHTASEYEAERDPLWKSVGAFFEMV